MISTKAFEVLTNEAEVGPIRVDKSIPGRLIISVPGLTCDNVYWKESHGVETNYEVSINSSNKPVKDLEEALEHVFRNICEKSQSAIIKAHIAGAALAKLRGIEL